MLEALAPYFEKYPLLHSIVINCYTPAFNDGDPCCFSRNYPNYYGKEEEEEVDISWEDANEIDKVLDLFHNKDFEVAFGDPARVTITKDNFHYEEDTNLY
jgi:hypothetical protein